MRNKILVGKCKIRSLTSRINYQYEYIIIMMETIPEYILDLTWPTVCGFSFTSILWGDVVVGYFNSHIEFSEKTFEQLVVLPVHIVNG